MEPASKREEFTFLNGGGEMGALMRSFRWEHSSLAAPDTWMQSLRTTLSILLHARLPMILFWGPEHRCFFNDAFLNAPGLNAGTGALAQPAELAFPEIWRHLGAQVRQVLSTGAAAPVEDVLLTVSKNGRHEEQFWSFSNSPVITVNNNVGGVLCICEETSDKVRAMEGLRISNERFVKLLRDASTGIAILNADNAVVSLANDAYARLIGRRSEQIIGHSMYALVPNSEETLGKIMSSVIRSSKTLRLYGQPFTAEDAEGNQVSGFVDAVYQPYIEADGIVSGVIVLCHDVTEQVESRQRLEESEHRLRSLVEAMPVRTLLFTGPDFKIALANAPVLRAWQKDRSILGKPLLEVVPEIRDQPFPQILRQVYESGEPFVANAMPVEYLNGGEELKTYYFNLSYQPMRDASGKIYGILSTAVDVTEKVRALRASEESGRNLRSLLESAPFPIGVYTGREMRIQLANDSIIRVWGKGCEVIGKRYAEVLPELEGSGIYEQLDRVFVTGEPFHAKNQRVDLVVNGERTTFYFNYSFTPLFDAQGKVYGVMNTAADVTDLVLAKQRLEQAELDLRTAVELAELATWSLDVKRGHITFSRRFMDWLGFVKQTKTLREAYNHLPPEYRRPVAREIIKALQPGSPGIYDHEHPLLNRRTGREHIIHMLAQVERDEQGRPALLRGMAQDVTEQRLLQRRLEQQVAERTTELAEANAQLQRSNEDLTQYAYVASHDLQEPLRKIRVFAGMLSRQELQTDSAELVRKTEEAAARMTQLIKDLLEFSKLLNADSLARPVDLNELCRAVVSDFDLTIREQQAEISIGSLPRVVAVALQMNQLFYNLIGNALKFSEPGRPPRISIASRAIPPEELPLLMPAYHPEWQYFDITVSDNGIGFDSKYSEQIFEVFKRLHGRNVYPGSGIGLALCRRIAANAMGLLYAESAPGQGATFHVILPDRNGLSGLSEDGQGARHFSRFRSDSV